MAKGYFLCADILGFGNIVKNLPSDGLAKRIDEWVTLVQTAAKDAGVPEPQLISDTVFAAAPDSLDGLASLVAFSRHLLERGLVASFPIRGGIVHGEYTFGKMTYGRAVVDAHVLEQSLDWVGVAVKHSSDNIRVLCDQGTLRVWTVPKKTGPIMALGAVVWSLPTGTEVTKCLLGGGLSRNGDVMQWEWLRKVKNTVDFLNNHPIR